MDKSKILMISDVVFSVLFMGCLLIGLMVPIPNQIYFWVAGVTFTAWLFSLMVSCKESGLWYYVTFTIFAVFRNTFLGMGSLMVFRVAESIFSLAILLFFIIVYLKISKNIFGSIVHTLNIILISTYSLFALAEVFSLYYLFNFAVNPDIFYFNETISAGYIMSWSSVRYFFDFPPDEYLNIFTFLQFMVGKVYEAVLIGGIASLVAKKIGNSEKD